MFLQAYPYLHGVYRNYYPLKISVKEFGLNSSSVSIISLKLYYRIKNSSGQKIATKIANVDEVKDKLMNLWGNIAEGYTPAKNKKKSLDYGIRLPN